MSMNQKSFESQLGVNSQVTLEVRLRQTILLVSLLCLLGAGPFASADAYLDALNSAADGLELDPKSTGEKGSSSSSVNASSEGESMPAGLSRDGFEVFLQKRFFGSFAFYEKLNSESKQKVFNAYGGQPNIDFVRDQIKRQYLSQ